MYSRPPVTSPLGTSLPAGFCNSYQQLFSNIKIQAIVCTYVSGCGRDESSCDEESERVEGLHFEIGRVFVLEFFLIKKGLLTLTLGFSDGMWVEVCSKQMLKGHKSVALSILSMKSPILHQLVNCCRDEMPRESWCSALSILPSASQVLLTCSTVVPNRRQPADAVSKSASFFIVEPGFMLRQPILSPDIGLHLKKQRLSLVYMALFQLSDASCGSLSQLQLDNKSRGYL